MSGRSSVEPVWDTRYCDVRRCEACGLPWINGGAFVPPARGFPCACTVCGVPCGWCGGGGLIRDAEMTGRCPVCKTPPCAACDGWGCRHCLGVPTQYVEPGYDDLGGEA